MSGWFAVHRGVWDHAIFAKEPFSEREAWVWLIGRAAHTDTKHRAGGKLVPVQRGSLFCTLRELAKVWRWKSDKRVRGFLQRLESQEMIGLKTDAGKTHVSICNYEIYQPEGRKTDAARTQDGRTKEEDNKITRSPPTPPEGDFDRFWAECPRKVGKGQAKKAYAKARKSATADDLLAGIQRFARSMQGKDPQYIAHPATWLNGERWTDEPPKGRGPGNEDDYLASIGIPKVRVCDADGGGNFSRGGDNTPPAPRDAEGDVPTVLSFPAKEDRPVPERDVRRRGGSLDVPSLRLERGFAL